MPKCWMPSARSLTIFRVISKTRRCMTNFAKNCVVISLIPATPFTTWRSARMVSAGWWIAWAAPGC